MNSPFVQMMKTYGGLNTFQYLTSGNVLYPTNESNEKK